MQSKRTVRKKLPSFFRVWGRRIAGLLPAPRSKAAKLVPSLSRPGEQPYSSRAGVAPTQISNRYQKIDTKTDKKIARISIRDKTKISTIIDCIKNAIMCREGATGIVHMRTLTTRESLALDTRRRKKKFFFCRTCASREVAWRGLLG